MGVDVDEAPTELDSVAKRVPPRVVMGESVSPPGLEVLATALGNALRRCDEARLRSTIRPRDGTAKRRPSERTQRCSRPPSLPTKNLERMRDGDDVFLSAKSDLRSGRGAAFRCGANERSRTAAHLRKPTQPAPKTTASPKTATPSKPVVPPRPTGNTFAPPPLPSNGKGSEPAPLPPQPVREGDQKLPEIKPVPSLRPPRASGIAPTGGDEENRSPAHAGSAEPERLRRRR